MSKSDDIPEDFAQYAPIESDNQLANRYGLSRKVVQRMRKNAGLVIKPKRESLPPPEDFVQSARTSTTTELAKKYGMGETTILRWARLTGVRPQTARGRLGGNVPYNRTITVSAAPGVAPAAARFLRERGYRPVYSRVIEHKSLANEYVVGRQKMTAEEMVELAAEKGFDRSAMYL
jgi:hypothetical protein